MARQRFDLESLGSMDPALAAQFQRLLKRLVNDCKERPLDPSPRLLTLQFLVRPKLHDQSATAECDHAEIELEMKAKVPTHRSRKYELLVHADESLSFNPDLPDDPDGRTLFDAEEQAEDERRRLKRKES